jgi:hypothetical protein
VKTVNKQKIYTAAAIMLSITVAVGGWVLISKLLDIKSEHLLSSSGVTWISEPVISPTETPNTEENSPEPSDSSMTEDDMVSVLRSFSSPGRTEPHEPTAGQISMEEAIAISEGALEFFGSLAFDKTKTTAYLRRKIPDNKNEQSLDLFYSFWDITFNGEDTRGFLTGAYITINAMTGKIWNLYIPIGLYGAVALSDGDVKNALARYVEYMGIIDYEEIIIENNTDPPPLYITMETKFAGGGGCAVIRIEPNPLPVKESETTLVCVHIYLYAPVPGQAWK